MALNPFREALGQAGRGAFENESPFQARAESALSHYQAVREDVERQVRHGDLTMKAAREQAGSAVAQLRDTLRSEAETFSPSSRLFLDRLVEVGNARKRLRENLSTEGLQRETNRLLRQSLIEQQLQNRTGEFEGRTFERSLTGGASSPTLESLLAFHELTANAGDEAAQEWARRQLEGMRGRALEPADQRRIDLACDRPDRVNPRLVGTYVEAMKDKPVEELETFVTQAIDNRDANACMAAFLLAREAPDGTRTRWARMVLNGLGQFPDAALNTLRNLEAETRNAETEAAKAHAEFAIARAEAEARLAGLVPPTEAELGRQAKLQAKPAANLGESIGLALDRRGLNTAELAAMTFPEIE